MNTSSSAAFAISLVFGEGEITGHSGTAAATAKYCYLHDIELSKAGRCCIGITMTEGMVLMDKVNMAVYVSKIFGPGMLYGALSMSGGRWFE